MMFRLANSLVLLAAMGLSTIAGARALPPQNQSRKNLTTIHWPEVSNLEAEVRDQLVALKKTLTGATNDPATTDAALANRFGEAGRIYHAYSLTLPARECYQNAQLLAPNDFRWPYLLAKIDQQEGHADDAINWFGKASMLNPEYIATDVNLGNIYLELNSPDRAQVSFKKALSRDPENPAAFYGLGQAALSERRYAEAADYFERALQKVPAANRIHYSLALAYRGLGDLNKAAIHLDQRGTVGVRVLDPLFDQLPELMAGERGYLIRGRKALDAKRLEDAANEFRKAIAAKPDSVTGHLNLATTLVQLNDLNGGAAEFRTVLRLAPDNADAHFNLAIVLATQQKHAEAVEELQALLKTAPDDTNARSFLGKELLKLDREEAALAEFLRVTQSDPNNEEAVLQAASLLTRAKQYSKAITIVDNSQRRHPMKVDTTAMLAQLLAASPQIELRSGPRALKLAETAFGATRLPQHGAIVALALAELGRCADAADWQHRMVAEAEKRKQTELAAKLTADLKLYENVRSCRPPGQ